MANVTDRFTNAALGAGASQNPFLGRQIAIAPFNGYLEVSVLGGALQTMDLIVGGKSIMSAVPIRVGTTYGVLPDDLDIQDEKVWAGTVIELRVTNPTAGPLAYWAYMRLSDEPRVK